MALAWDYIIPVLMLLYEEGSTHKVSKTPKRSREKNVTGSRSTMGSARRENVESRELGES